MLSTIPKNVSYLYVFAFIEWIFLYLSCNFRQDGKYENSILVCEAILYFSNLLYDVQISCERCGHFALNRCEIDVPTVNLHGTSVWDL